MLALVVSALMFALPSVASAGTWHIKPNPTTFTFEGLTPTLKTANGLTVVCDAVKGKGEYEAGGTTGKITEMTFGPNCKSSGLISGTCTGTSPVEPAGNIAATVPMVIHNIELEPLQKEPYGVLITPVGAETEVMKHFSTFTCVGIKTVVEGTGIIGEITSPKCGVASNKATLKFASTSPGNQAWTQITTSGHKYDLTSTVFGATTTSSMDATATITFPQAETAECT